MAISWSRKLRHASRVVVSTLSMVAMLGPVPAAPAGLPVPPRVATAHARAPNVLFVLVDDLGARDLGHAGSRYYESPNLDAFARRSARFSEAYSPSTVCSPSRAAILTGKDPARLGITTWFPGLEYENQPLIEPAIPEHLPLSEVTIAEAFKAGGYQTFFAGKWHLGGPGALPTDQGFDTNFGGGEWGQPRGGWFAPYKNAYLADGPRGEFLEDRLTQETIRFLEGAKQGDRPFFAFVSYYAVHTPIEAAPGGQIEHFRKKARALTHKPLIGERSEGRGRTKLVQDNAAYASMIKAMDGNFGRLLAALDRLGLRDDTIVVFTSDNGGLSTLDPEISLYKDGTPTSNEPLRAGKGWTYEGGIRVPLLISGPGVRRQTIGAPVVLTDLYATLLDLTGLPPAMESDGISLKPLVGGQRKGEERTFFWHYPHYHGSGAKPATAVRRGDWKLVHNYENDSWELFYLRIDPFEKRNLAMRDPARLRAMQDEMKRMIAQTSARMPNRRNSTTR